MIKVRRAYGRPLELSWEPRLTPEKLLSKIGDDFAYDNVLITSLSGSPGGLYCRRENFDSIEIPDNTRVWFRDSIVGG